MLISWAIWGLWDKLDLELCSRAQKNEFLSFSSRKVQDVFSWSKLRIFRNELGFEAILQFLTILEHPLFRNALIWASLEAIYRGWSGDFREIAILARLNYDLKCFENESNLSNILNLPKYDKLERLR